MEEKKNNFISYFLIAVLLAFLLMQSKTCNAQRITKTFCIPNKGCCTVTWDNKTHYVWRTVGDTVNYYHMKKRPISNKKLFKMKKQLKANKAALIMIGDRYYSGVKNNRVQTSLPVVAAKLFFPSSTEIQQVEQVLKARRREYSVKEFTV